MLLAGGVSSVIFRRVLSGVGDFSKFGGRYQQVLKGMWRGRKANQKIPVSLDMNNWMCDVFSQA